MTPDAPLDPDSPHLGPEAEEARPTLATHDEAAAPPADPAPKGGFKPYWDGGGNKGKPFGKAGPPPIKGLPPGIFGGKAKAKGKFGAYLLARNENPPERLDRDVAAQRVEESLLFIEASHACEARLTAEAGAADVKV